MEFQFLDRLNFQRFAGLWASSQIPGRTTERLIKAHASERTSAAVNRYLGMQSGQVQGRLTPCRPCRCATGASPTARGCGSRSPKQRWPAILTGPYPAHVCGPAVIGCLRHRRQGLDARPEADGALTHLPALELENALHGVLIHAQQVCHRAVAEGRRLLDHGLDGLGQRGPDLRGRLSRLVVSGTARYLQPFAQLACRDVQSNLL